MYVILEWSSGKKTQNEEQDADIQSQAVTH